MAKTNTFRMKKKQSNVTKIELMPQPVRKRQIETIAIDLQGKQVDNNIAPPSQAEMYRTATDQMIKPDESCV